MKLAAILRYPTDDLCHLLLDCGCTLDLPDLPEEGFSDLPCPMHEPHRYSDIFSKALTTAPISVP